MKKLNKPKVNKGLTNVLTFKKPKTKGKLKLPKEVTLDENIIKKTKFDKSQTKKGKKNLTEINGGAPAVKKAKANHEKKVICPVSFPLVKGIPGNKTKNNATYEAPSHAEAETRAKAPSALKVKKAKKILPSKYVTDEIVTKAVNALQQLAEQQKNKSKMFEEEANVFAQILSIKIQSKKTNIKIVLPHSTVASTGEVCLITTDLKKGRKHDHEPSVHHWEEVLRNAKVTQVKTVLPMRQLRVEYDQFELKRRLLTQYDFILVDSRIHSHVCHILGKVFFNKHNMLIPVRLHNEKDIKKNIETALKTVQLHLSEGATSTLLVGHMGMSVKEIKDNVLALVGQLALKFPGGEHNIRSLNIKLPTSLALPLYITLRSKRTIHPPKIHTDLPKQHQVVEGELSTIPGSKVKISPEGTIIVDRSYENEMSDFEEIDESNEAPKSKKGKKTPGSKETNPPDSDSEEGDAHTSQDMDSENEEVSGSDHSTSDSDNDNVSGQASGAEQ